MPKILIASGNSHKHDEISRLLATSGWTGVELVRPRDCEVVKDGRPVPPPDPEENGSTYIENARIKAEAFSRWSGMPALADDSGLEVDALGGAPGLQSARYAGENVPFAANIEKLLHALEKTPDSQRSGRFICALVLWADGETLFSTVGTCRGTVLEAPTGDEGFGYDPVFRPSDETRSFAELTEAEKDAKSHRGIAFRAFIEHMRSNPVHPLGSGGPPRR